MTANDNLGNDENTLLWGAIAEGKGAKTDQPRPRQPQGVVYRRRGHYLRPGGAGVGETLRTPETQAQCLTKPHETLA